jgi:hypothetical protein
VSRLVRAEWVTGQRITRIGKGTRPRTAANGAIFASATLASELIGRMQRAEDRSIAINIDEMFRRRAADRGRQESSWVSVTLVGNENDLVTVADSKSATYGSLFDLVRSFAGFSHAV